ncbi:MAG: zinc-ribbon domain-containing protein [Oscillospiraceae bacterium]|nr:zinc-ribbon domain-containing protein [Oscillospiraceae bacterium]
MYCTQCGTQKPPNATYCPQCGTAQAATTQPAPYQQVPYPAYPQQHPYKRIGGALAFWLVWTILAMLLATFLLLYGAAGVFAERGFLLDLAMGAVLLATCVPTLQLFARQPSFLKHFHIAWMAFAGVFLLYFVWLISRVAIDLDVSYRYELIGQIIIASFFVGIFFIQRHYFTRSVRVRTYMGNDAYLKQSVFARHVTPPIPAVPDDNPPQSF